MRRLRVRGEARADIVLAMDHIAKDSPRSALRFRQAVEKLGNRLLDFPELGAIYESGEADFDGIRAFAVPRFRKHLVFYRVHADVIEIIRVLHGARDIPSLLEGR